MKRNYVDGYGDDGDDCTITIAATVMMKTMATFATTGDADDCG